MRGVALTSLEEALEATRLLLEAITRGEYCCLRHGLPYVTPGLLAEQVFCEARLDYRLARGEAREPPPSPMQARRLLQALIGAKRRLWTGEERAVSLPLAALLQGVPVVGRPPVMALNGECVSAIYSVKVSRRPRLYPGDRVKLYTYALLASSNRLLCPDARLATVVVPEPIALQELIHLLPDPAHPRPLQGSAVSIHVLAHDPETEEAMLAPLLAYWRGDRPPKPKPGSWCSRCPYFEICRAK